MTKRKMVSPFKTINLVCWRMERVFEKVVKKIAERGKDEAPYMGLLSRYTCALEAQYVLHKRCTHTDSSVLLTQLCARLGRSRWEKKNESWNKLIHF